ncbi:hypothetical protein PR048_022299 [Dryococelus australis]|uniref:Uncharacterized protein n=1 Tax=Dryococelus australis TaxID=614101 RepID=A0ABQ9H0Q7_9NEOP|nr:hypothetical protein PR048_022299 [Dryococelus australis]
MVVFRLSLIVMLAALPTEKVSAERDSRWFQTETLHTVLSWIFGNPGSSDILQKSMEGGSYFVAGKEVVRCTTMIYTCV